MNQTTHTAEVRFPSGSGLAVVKAFSVHDKGWFNEAIAWTLARALSIATPPRAMLLAAAPQELLGVSEPELVEAAHRLGSQGPVVLWCASRLEVKPPQYVWSASWEHSVLRGDSGRRLAAFDGWIGNCDRIADNAPYWVSRGVIAAIDHEKMAFGQDWVSSTPHHLDRQRVYGTRLIERYKQAKRGKVFSSREAKTIGSSLELLSRDHGPALAGLHHEIERLITSNSGSAAATNLLNFLAERATEAFISERLEVL